MKKHIIGKTTIREGLEVNLLDPKCKNDGTVTYVAVYRNDNGTRKVSFAYSLELLQLQIDKNKIYDKYTKEYYKELDNFSTCANKVELLRKAYHAEIYCLDIPCLRPYSAIWEDPIFSGLL